jgi:hypothetical protein
MTILKARISHQISTAAAHPGMFTALRSVGFLDVLSSTPAESSPRAGQSARCALYPRPSAPPRYEICSENNVEGYRLKVTG